MFAEWDSVRFPSTARLNFTHKKLIRGALISIFGCEILDASTKDCSNSELFSLLRMISRTFPEFFCRYFGIEQGKRACTSVEGNNEEGDVVEKTSRISRKRLLVETELEVRRKNPVQNKFLRAARYFNLPNRKVYRKKRQKFKKKRKPCYICADWGHSGNFCPRVNTCSVCSKEESKNNVEEDHTSLFCLKCGGTGHGMFSCTNDYDPEDLKGIQCYICMDFGHLCCNENSTGGPTEASCYNCGQSGHCGFECTKMNAVANELQPVSICFKCQKAVHSPETWDFKKATSAKTITLGKDEVLDKSMKENSRQTQAGEKVNKSTLAKTSTSKKDAVPDISIERKSQKTRRKERRRKRKPVIPTSNVVQSLPTMSMIGNTIPRHGQYYGNPGSNIWLSPPAAAARNCLVNSPAVNQSSYGRPGLNVWLSPPAAAARNCLVNSQALNQSSYGRSGLNVWLPPPAAATRNYLEIFPAVNQSSHQTGFHFYHNNTNYREATTDVPPNSFRPCGLRPHEIFEQGTQIPGIPQNRIQLPHQNFTHQIRTHVPQSTFDSRMGICQPPELPHHVSNHRINALLPHQKIQHQLPSHGKWMAPPTWKPYS